MGHGRAIQARDWRFGHRMWLHRWRKRKSQLSKSPGHAEALRIVFDTTQTSLLKLLDFFFRMHDPTTLNRQGYDIGTSYRSAIFYKDETQKQCAEKMINLVNSSGMWRNPVATILEPWALFGQLRTITRTICKRIPVATPVIIYAKLSRLISRRTNLFRLLTVHQKKMLAFVQTLCFGTINTGWVAYMISLVFTLKESLSTMAQPTLIFLQEDYLGCYK